MDSGGGSGPVGSRESALLSATEEVDLARAVEAGVLARQARLADPPPRWAGAELAGLPELAAELDEWAAELAELAEPAELAELERIGAAAQRRLVTANLRLVGLVVSRYARTSRVSRLDLFQDGCLGLIDAMRRFDYARGHRFATYALIRIRAAVSESALRGSAGPGESLTAVRESGRLHRAEGELAQQLGRSVSAGEVARAVGRDAAWVRRVSGREVPIPWHDLAGTPVEPGVWPDAGGSGEVGSVAVEDLVDRLGPVHRRVVQLRFGLVGEGEPASLRAVAGAIGCTLGVVRRLEREALEELRGHCPQQARALF